MSKKSKAERYSEEFEKKLIAYQKTGLVLLLHPLVSTFVYLLSAFSMQLGNGLRMGYSLFLEVACPTLEVIWNGVIAVAILTGFILLTIFGIKGKIYLIDIGAGLYIIDIVFLILAFAQTGDVLSLVLSLIIHLVVLGALTFANIFYFQAKKLLEQC